MHKNIEIIRALVSGKASIEHVSKTRVSTTLGNVTELGHN
jgi:hypothetical protein